MLRHLRAGAAQWPGWVQSGYYLKMPYYTVIVVSEKGKFLALDLGGTNFRVLLIHLKGDNDFEMQSKIYAIPQSIMIGSGTQLFDHIAECLSNFMKVGLTHHHITGLATETTTSLQEHDVYQEKLPLGFTFSFPLEQLGLTKGILSRWTKGFNCEGVVGEDVVRLLKEAIARRGVSTGCDRDRSES